MMEQHPETYAMLALMAVVYAIGLWALVREAREIRRKLRHQQWQREMEETEVTYGSD